MTAAARTDFRRGACPGLSTPMQTGDGLLARLMPVDTIALDALSGLCAAAQRHGNGIIELTSRGNIQIRSLNDATAFADAVARLGIAANDGVPVICGPLTGLDPAELIDAGALAAELRKALAAQSFADRLAPKVSVAIDGGGVLHLDAIAADICLRAVPSHAGPRLQVAVGGDAASATPLGTIAVADAIDTVLRLLRDIATHGPDARARDVIRAAQIDACAPAPRGRADPIGLHRLCRNRVAAGIGFPFGHTDAATLNSLIRAARGVGATGVRISPGRALLVLGIASRDAGGFVAAADRIGFIVDPVDPRRRVIACAGAPICASGEIAARALAPDIARSVMPLLRRDEVVHISGCAKGCAYQGAAALTVIGHDGACDIVVDGAPAGSCPAEKLRRRLAQIAIHQRRTLRHD